MSVLPKILKGVSILTFSSAFLTAHDTSPITNTPAPSTPNAINNVQKTPGQPTTSYVDEVVLAPATKGIDKEPVSPTTTFGPQDTFHAVVKIKNAPQNTNIKVSWYVDNVGIPSLANTLIDSSDIVSEGTRNIDFMLSPTSSWPPGTYRVEINVDGAIDTIKKFTVKGK